MPSASPSAGKLTALQRRVLEEFFARESRFILTGGAALGGFHLGHRPTKDLDLFSTSAPVEEADRVLREVATAMQGEIVELTTAPDFRRRLVRTASGAVMVDLVRDRAVHGDTPPVKFGTILVDAPEEILANKLCTLLSRSERRDLVDVLALERAGYRVEDAMPLAERKDGGMTPGQFGWVLSTIEIGEDAILPEGFTPADLRSLLAELRLRMGRLASPG